MKSRTWRVGVAIVVLGVLALGVFPAWVGSFGGSGPAFAQPQPGGAQPERPAGGPQPQPVAPQPRPGGPPPGRPGPVPPERPGARQPHAPREVTLTGRVVDLHCFMTGKYPSADPDRCTAECLRQGVPAALETDTGLIVLGQGTGGPTKTLMPLAYQPVEVRGRLFEKAGVRYLDISSIRKAAGPEEGEGEDEPEADTGEELE